MTRPAFRRALPVMAERRLAQPPGPTCRCDSLSVASRATGTAFTTRGVGAPTTAVHCRLSETRRRRRRSPRPCSASERTRTARSPRRRRPVCALRATVRHRVQVGFATAPTMTTTRRTGWIGRTRSRGLSRGETPCPPLSTPVHPFVRQWAVATHLTLSLELFMAGAKGRPHASSSAAREGPRASRRHTFPPASLDAQARDVYSLRVCTVDEAPGVRSPALTLAPQSALHTCLGQRLHLAFTTRWPGYGRQRANCEPTPSLGPSPF